MRKSLLFSVALGLVVSTDAVASETHNVVSRADVASILRSDRNIQDAVKGKVTGAEGPIGGVTVSVVGSSVSTSTDGDGNFTIQAPVGATVRFSYLGYLEKEVVISSNTLNVTLEAGDTTLDEVVVVGYGS